MGRSALKVGLATSFLVLVLALTLSAVRPAQADEGWVINSFEASIEIASDGTLQISETVIVNFGVLSKHGIFRDIPVVYDNGDKINRVYDLSVRSVKDAGGRSLKYETSREGSYDRIKIGDPDVTVSGAQTYRIAYSVRHALNAFPDHDELYWNINGQWPVQTQKTLATVKLTGDGVQQVACYQGATGSTETCSAENTARTANFSTTRALPENQQMTIVVAMAKGLVPEPKPKFERQPREFVEYFDTTPITLAGGLIVLIISFGLLAMAWWRFGRDRRFTSVYYLTDSPKEETRPLFDNDPLVIEYTPPDNLRPGQLGLILDESADTLDVTATAIDLAVRGYLTIREVKNEGLIGGLFSKRDWELTRTKSDANLLEFESTVLRGLFAHGSPVMLAHLKNRFYTYLKTSKDELYKDAMKRRWFIMRPDRAQALWAGIGVGVTIAGVAATLFLGSSLAAGLVTTPLVLAGVLLLFMARSMPKRSAIGREVLRRALGFRHYVATAEKDRQRFNEATNLFAEYLPYAIVFRCVDKWARAFEGLDVQTSTNTWYYGTSLFMATQFSHDMQDFSSAVSSTVVSTPSSSGRSGFGGGGFSGGGGGGGGGGSW
ncbi:MAG: DUF2207 domain-containing protein [Dehalococcoidia bacterium]|nr:DUF2207 domain-containing protein [Dehalococcoidia bacterium]